jgi:endonuclease YncB( thermonuclease family)
MSEAETQQTPPDATVPADAATRRGLPLAGMAAGLVILAIGVGVLLLGQNRPGSVSETASEAAPHPTGDVVSRPSAERSAEAPPASRERQTAVRLLSGWRGDAADPLAAGDRVEGRFEPVLRPPPPYDAVDSVLIDTLDTRIRLAHARAVPRDEACRDEAGRRFACGLQSRAALQNHVSGKTLVCRRLFLGDPGKTGIVEVRCSVDGEDLATRQIRAGWATPSEIAEPEHLAALEEARRAKRGVWAGPWQIPARDPSEADAREIGFGTLRIGGGGSPTVAKPPG